MKNERTEPCPPNTASRGLVAQLLSLEVSADAICWHRFFGALLVALLASVPVRGVDGLCLYTGSGDAYDSVDYFQFSLPGKRGPGVHHYAWNLLLVVMGLHLLRRSSWGLQGPRQIVWISGCRSSC
jgi:quinol-cytochrome oxidoreductase complex cytochrome b subunit